MIQNIPTFSTGLALTPGESRYPYLWKGLVGMWCPSVGKQGDKLLDLSLYNRFGTLTNMASSDYVPGITGYALNYDGVNDFVNIGNVAEINDASQDISIVMWARTTGGGSNCFWYYDGDDALSPAFDAYLIQPSNLQIGGIGQGGQIATGVSVNDGLWHQIAVVLKGTSLILYKDSIPVFSTSVAHNHANYSTSLRFRLGDNANVAHHVGDIGDTLLYNRALSSSEITDLFNNRSPLVEYIFPVAKPGLQSQEDSETVQITDSILVTDTSILESDTILIADSIDVQDTTAQESETLQISDSIIVTDTNTDAKFISKIISINPLIFVTDTSPLEIIKVDTTDPENITFQVKAISGVNSAKDIAVLNDFIYIAGSNGQVVKVEIADLSNDTIIDLSDTDDLLTIETNSNLGLTYAGTENDTGELYLIDERATFKVDSDFRVLAPLEFPLESDFNIVKIFRVDSDFQLLAQTTFLVESDFKCITKPEVIVFPPPPPDPSPPPAPSPITPLDTIVPIDLTDFQVFIDSVELEDTDLILNSISISHLQAEESRATFQLSRKHDQLNTTLQGTSVQITNQNNVEIKIRGVTEFNGKTANLDCKYNNNIEFVQVTALADEKVNQSNNITMSLPGLNSRLSLYDILVQNPKILNPFIDPLNEENPKKFKGIRVPLGSVTEESVSSFIIDDASGSTADKIQEGTFNPLYNWSYFWSPSVRKFGEVKLGEISGFFFAYIGTSLSPVSEDLWELTQADHRRQRIFNSTVNKLGDGAVAVSDFDGIVDNPLAVHLELQEKGFLQGEVAITEKFKKTQDSSELNLIGITLNEQEEVYNIIENRLGFTVGEAPFKDISVRSGQTITKFKYTDEPSQLISIRDSSFNFTEFAKRVAELEFEKLQNINGDILPDTSCTFNLTVDGYLYYGISLLTKINVDNTTESGIYKNLNGFPLSVKSITINSADRKVTVEANNIKSTKELEEIDGKFPGELDDEYNEKEKRFAIANKSNMRTTLEVE